MSGIGASDLRLLEELDCFEIRKPDRLIGRTVVDALIFVGGMCAGKSTMARAIAAHGSTATAYAIAARVTTRTRRLADDLEAVTNISWDDFERRRIRGDLALSWIRPLVDGDAIGYGCESVQQGLVALQLAGHGIYSNTASVAPHDVLDRSLLVGVLAPEEQRFERVRQRSPDLGIAQLQSLMQHDDELMLRSVDVVIHNVSDRDGPGEDAVSFASLVGRRCSCSTR